MRLQGEGDYDFEIVGEGYYQDALEAICGPKTDAGHEHYCEAEIVMEDDNEHDANAVAVFIEGRKVGYLSRDEAPTYRRMMAPFGEAGRRVTCDARINGGWDRGERGSGSFGVELDIGPPDGQPANRGGGCLAAVLAIGLGLTLLAGVGGAAAADPPVWKVDSEVSALDGQRSATAMLESTNEIPNSIGRPETAALVIRCTRGKLEAYIAWPRLAGIRQTWGAWRAGEGEIQREDFSVSTSGTGTFWRSGRIRHLMAELRQGDRQLVVRTEPGDFSSQEAVFDLGQSAPAVAAVEAACGAG